MRVSLRKLPAACDLRNVEFVRSSYAGRCLPLVDRQTKFVSQIFVDAAVDVGLVDPARPGTPRTNVKPARSGCARSAAPANCSRKSRRPKARRATSTLDPSHDARGPKHSRSAASRTHNRHAGRSSPMCPTSSATTRPAGLRCPPPVQSSRRNVAGLERWKGPPSDISDSVRPPPLPGTGRAPKGGPPTSPTPKPNHIP
jgi:hypothetical protein